MRLIVGIIAAMLLSATAHAKPFAEMFPQYADMPAGDERSFFESLDYQQGVIDLPGGFAKIDTGPSLYYLTPLDARKVLEDYWGNPPDTSPLGMLFRADATAADDDWGVLITWDEMGYVSDDDADDIDYDDLLDEMKQDTRDENEWRAENGYGPIELVGWAAPPFYDKAERKLHWAKELKFGEAEENTLNYNLRVLGRKGVLNMNFIASMGQLHKVERDLPTVLASANFIEGSKYSDFDPGLDTVAAVGIGGLIAGKVLSKAALLPLLLIFLKKGGFLLILPILWLFKKLTG